MNNSLWSCRVEIIQSGGHFELVHVCARAMHVRILIINPVAHLAHLFASSRSHLSKNDLIWHPLIACVPSESRWAPHHPNGSLTWYSIRRYRCRTSTLLNNYRQPSTSHPPPVLLSDVSILQSRLAHCKRKWTPTILGNSISIIQITIFAFKASQLLPYALFHRGSPSLRKLSLIL